MFNRKRGFTFVETMISAVVVAFVILATVNLITRVYKGITTLSIKTQASNICSENLEILKEAGFANLPITPDSCLPNPLSNLDVGNCPSNPDILKTQTMVTGGYTYTIYKMVQYVQEQADGSLTPVRQADMGTDDNRDLKQVTVITAYTDNGVQKTSSMTTLVANKEVPIPGAQVSGQIIKLNALGTPIPTGAGSNATVYVVGYPQYTAMQTDSNGNYTIPNMMPGQYNLYAQGLGFATTYYTANPLIVSSTAQIITGINIRCPKVDGASISGNVYTSFVMTPSATPTPLPTVATVGPTAICGTAILMATGSMTGQSSGWTSPNLLTVQDTNWAYEYGSNNVLIYTNFDDTTIANTVISAVRLKSLTQSVLTGGTKNCPLYITNNNGSRWASACCGSPATWGATKVNFQNLPFSTSATIQTTTLTSLYTAANWDWAKVNALGAAVSSTGLGCFIICSSEQIDAMWLEVDYCQYTPTPLNTPTYTYTPNTTPTPTPVPCGNGATVKAFDGVSLSTLVSGCGYTITDVNPAGGFTSVSATLEYGGKSYYGLVTGVPVVVNGTTYQDIFLTETTGVPTINGNVYEVGGAIPIVGADVYLSDPQAVSPTTSGGGAYTIFPVDTGSAWDLTCSKPGYKMQSAQSINPVAGINVAPNLYMYKVGNLSGQVTNELDASGVSGLDIQLLDTSNTIVSETYTDAGGNYSMMDLPVASNYVLKVITTSTDWDCTYPISKRYTNVAITQGTTLTNRNFRVRQNSQPITGKIQINSADMLSGIMVIAYPVGAAYHAQDFRYDLGNTNILQGETGRARINYPYYGQISERDATYNVNVPVGSNYDIYAYYSCITYTGSTKSVLKYYKVITNVAPNSTGKDITGLLSTWTSY